MRTPFSSVIIAGCGVNRDERKNLSPHLHIDQIEAVSQILIVFRKYAVFLEQVLREGFFPGLVIMGFLPVDRNRFLTGDLRNGLLPGLPGLGPGFSAGC